MPFRPETPEKRDLDVYEASTNSNSVTDDLQDIRDNVKDIWSEWFDLAVSTAANVGVVPSIPRRTNQHQHCDNLPAQTPSDYYKRAVAIPFLDHLQSEMKTYFKTTNDVVLSRLFNLLPELVAVGDRNPDIEAALEFYENYLPSPHMVDVELLRWKRKWCSTEDADLSTSAVQTLAACDREFFPNIHTLIRILCTLPITSTECERSFSTLRRCKNIPEVDHVKRARVWAGVDEHQLPPRHKYRGSDKHVRSTATKASSVCVA